MNAKTLRIGSVVFGLALMVFFGCAKIAGKKAKEAGAPLPEVRSTDVGAGKQRAESTSSTSQPTTEPRRTGEGSLEEFKKGTLGQAKGGQAPDIHFGFDRYDLTAESRGTLRMLADSIAKNPEARIEIEGHADERGTVEYNLALGAKRAQAAKDYLVSLGVPAPRLSTVSYGEELPLCKESNEECWEKNRRDHFVLRAGSKPVS